MTKPALFSSNASFLFAVNSPQFRFACAREAQQAGAALSRK